MDEEEHSKGRLLKGLFWGSSGILIEIIRVSSGREFQSRGEMTENCFFTQRCSDICMG